MKDQVDEDQVGRNATGREGRGGGERGGGGGEEGSGDRNPERRVVRQLTPSNPSSGFQQGSQLRVWGSNFVFASGV